MKIIEKKYNTIKLKRLAAGFLCLTSLVAMESCSDDLETRTGILPDEGNSLIVNLNIPAVKVINTRAGEDENTVNEAMLFLFDSNGSFLSSEALTSATISDISTQTAIKKRIGCVIDKSVKDGMATVYVVTNANNILIGGSSGLSDFTGRLTELEQLVAEASSSGVMLPLIMSGKQSVTGNQNEIDVTVNRLAAKMTVEQASTVEGYEVKSFTLYKSSAGAYLKMPDPSEFQVYTGGGQLNLKSDGIGIENPVYSYPSYGASSTAHQSDGAYLIICAENRVSGEESYYRLNLRTKENKNGSLEYQPLNIVSNNWYKVQIEQILSDGYPDADTAAQHPEDSGEEKVVYDIHDHAANIFSMVTDGIRELGVTAELQWYDWDGVTGENPNTFTVRWYSALDGEEASMPVMEIVEGDDWLDFARNGEEYDCDDDTDLSGSGNETSVMQGTVKKFRLVKKAEGSYALIKVSWKGLTREVVVTRTPKSDYSDETRIELRIYKGNDEGKELYATIEDYWTFIKGEGRLTVKDAEGNSAPYLFGVDEAAMGKGKSRIGLHFPVMYGENSNDPWTYEYTFSSKRNDVTAVRPTITTAETDAVIRNNIKIEGREWGSTITDGNYTLKLTFDSKTAGYDYGIGEILIIVERGGNEAADWIYLPVYHTGFFDFNDKSSVTENKGYYYYEVVPMADMHWLDRNLGAKSRRMFVDNITSHYGSEDAAGFYYSVASQQTFTDPLINDVAVCPPGYHVPSSLEWDKVRLDSRFITGSITDFDESFSGTYYSTGNSRIGNVYFPKARFYNLAGSNSNGSDFKEEANSGVAGSGYYWTSSAAPAMEKDELGNWLRSMYLLGSSSSINNASVSDHKMPVRCAAGNEAEPDVQNPISFNVHYATHVYLFNRETQVPLYNFPGRSLGTAEAVKSWLNFYCTTNLEAKDMLVLFARMESNGQITLYTRNGNTFASDKKLSEIELNEENAWEIKMGAYYDFCPQAEDRPNNVTDTNPDPVDIPTSFMNGDKITVHWKSLYEGKEHDAISCGDDGWNNIMSDWGISGERDEKDGFLKTTFYCGRETNRIRLNVETKGSANRIRYQIDFNTVEDISIFYHKDTGDQNINQTEPLNADARVEYGGYDPSIFGHVYDIYLYQRDTPGFYEGSKITFHWFNEYSGIYHPNIYSWSNISGQEDFGGFWDHPAEKDSNNNCWATIESLENETKNFYILVFNPSPPDGNVDGTKIRFEIESNNGRFTMRTNQGAENGSQDIGDLKIGDINWTWDEEEGRYVFDIYLMSL